MNRNEIISVIIRRTNEAWESLHCAEEECGIMDGFTCVLRNYWVSLNELCEELGIDWLGGCDHPGYDV